MRADRLLALLMLLQSRGRMSARQLAEELEVSERTIYRDIDALSVAGVPIYSEHGPNGGYALIEDYRTDLTGLTEGEVCALFMLSIPAALADLGASDELKSAFRKLSAALPDTRRRDEERVRQRFHFDSTWWQQAADPLPHLQTIQRAVWRDCKLHITYRPVLAVEIQRIVAPYGLVAKAGVWYLVHSGNGAVRVHRVSHLLDARESEETFERPPDFDLAAFWEAWCAEHESLFSAFRATVRVAPEFVPELPRYFGSQIHADIGRSGPPDSAGRITLELSFESFEAARERLLGFGRGVEVLAPRALRRSVLDVAQQTVVLYTHESVADRCDS